MFFFFSPNKTGFVFILSFFVARCFNYNRSVPYLNPALITWKNKTAGVPRSGDILNAVGPYFAEFLDAFFFSLPPFKSGNLSKRKMNLYTADERFEKTRKECRCFRKKAKDFVG